MEEIMKVKGLNKTFTLSQKQQKIEKTNEKKRIAVHDLSFTSYRGEVCLDQTEPERQPHFVCWQH